MNFCLDEGRDDMPFIIQPLFELPDEEFYNLEQKNETFSICSPTLKGVNHGRWVLQPNLNCSMELDHSQSKFPMYVHKHTEPEDCWIHDRLIGNSCEHGCTRNPKSNLWKSNLTKEIFTYVWKPYDCNLLLYTDEMLARCFQQNGYSKPTVIGDSVAEFFREYLNKRFDSIDTAIYGNKTVTLNNFQMMHMIWLKSYSEWDTLLQHRNDFTLKKDAIGIWLNGPFLSSEREMHVTHGRMSKFVDMARPVLVNRYGWKEVDWRNVSMAVSYESATQYDGLHVVGSAMKTAFHLAMHALCGSENNLNEKTSNNDN